MRKFCVLITSLFTFLMVQGQSTQVLNFNQGGTFSWTAPCDVSQITVEAWGAGAAANGNGGGGGGAYAKKVITVTPGQTYILIVGRGGGSYSSDKGENSTFNGTTVKAEGGGQYGTGYIYGGRASNSIGDVKYSGGNGVNGTGRGGGGGGSSASSINSGNNGQNTGGNGGGNGGVAVAPDGGKGGDGGNSNSHWYGYSGGNGQNGNTPGGGGGQGGTGSGWGGDGRHADGASGQIKITYEGLAYCSPSIGRVEPISYVKFAGIDNITSTALTAPKIESFCDEASVNRGQSYPITVRGNTDGRYKDYFTVFIDWNQNGNFESSERTDIGTITNSNGNSPSITKNISVPANAKTGLTKMRVLKNWNNNPADPCGSYSYGQAEEYVVNVQDPSATITSFAPTSGCIGTLVTINGTNFTSATEVRFNGTSATTFTVVSATKITAEVPSGATSGKISVVTPSNTATSSTNFTVNATSTVTSISGGGTHCGTTTLVASGSGTIYFQGSNENSTRTDLGGASVSVTSSGTYYFKSYNGSCWSPAKSVDVVIEQTPAAVSVSGGGTFCGSTTITATGGAGGTIYFQGTTSNGNSTADNSTTKTITSSGTYYFRSINSCGGGTEGSVTVTINPLPGVIVVTTPDNQFCGSTGTQLTATGGSGGTIYFQGTTANGTSTADTYTAPVTVFESGTYYFRAQSSKGCWGPEKSITVTKTASFVITSQPTDVIACAGGNATFSVTVSPNTGISYQWYKGSDKITGATNNTYTISNVNASNQSTDYYSVITDNCGNATTNHVSLTVNPVAAAPAAQPTALVFITGATSAIGSFTATDAGGYLVVRTTSATAPANPVNGTDYSALVGQAALGGIIESFSPSNTFTSTGLAQGTQYWYWVYAFNVSTCGTSPFYRTASPLNGTITTGTTTTCGSLITLYWAGDGSVISGSRNDDNFNDYRNWSTSATSYVMAAAAPTSCTDVSIRLRKETDNFIIFELGNNPNLKLSNSIQVHDLNYFAEEGNWSLFGFFKFAIASNTSINLNGKMLEVFGDANVKINYDESDAVIGDFGTANNGVIDFKADATFGNTNYTRGIAGLYGNSNTKAIFRGSLTLGKMAGIEESNPVDATFDGIATTITWSNTVNTARFRNVIIGSSNSPQLTFAGSQIADNILGNLTMNNASKLILGVGKQWNRQSNGGTFKMNGTSSVVLYDNQSASNGGSATIIAGSNFPSGFTPTLSATSSVQYNGGTAITQTINSVPNYGKIDLLNANTSGVANKINDVTVNHQGEITVQKNTRWTLGSPVSGAGKVTIQNDGILMMGNYLSTGAGLFNVNAGGTLGIGNSAGISLSGATGNVQNSGRTFSNDANYIYNGTAHQVAGNGLPTQQRNLEINNNANVELSGDAEPVQLLKLTTGNLEIKNHTLTLNTVAYGSNKLVGSDVSNVTVKGTNVGLYLSSALKENTLKELTFLDNATGQLSTSIGDTLNITGGFNSSNPAGHLTLGTGSKITTGGNLTLQSNKFGTAAIAEIPQNVAGNILSTITGDIIVERYINVGTTADGQHGKKWIFLSTPTTGQSIKQSWMENGNKPDGYGIYLTGSAGGGWDRTSPNPSIKEYDPSAYLGFTGASSSARPLYNPKGWFVFVRGDRSVTGQGTHKDATRTVVRSKGKVETGRHTFAVTSTVPGFKAIGNPYPSSIDMTKVFNEDGLTFYVWNPNLGGDYGYGAYESYSYDDVSGNFESTPFGTINNYIMSGQGFFVQTDPTSPDIVINETAKENSSGVNTYFRPGRGNGTAKPARLRSDLYSASGALLDGTLQKFSDNYSNEIDRFDARKMLNTGVNLSVKVDNKLLIVERKETISRADTIFFNLTGTANGKYKFQFLAENLSTPGLEAWLEDAFSGTRTPVQLEGTTDISFDVTSATASKAANRFRIVFKPQAPLPVTFVDVKAVKDGSDISVQWTVANEISINKYVVMKSTDGNNFSDIASVKANGGTAYNSLDKNVLDGYNYYRIRNEDKNGELAYSAIVKVWAGNLTQSITVFPNPIVNGVLNLKLENQPAGKYSVRLLNPIDQVLLTRQFDHAGGTYSEKIPWDYKMAHGVYHMEVTRPDGTVKAIMIMY